MLEMQANPAPLRWLNRPEGSNWGDYGPDDELGRLNLITPEAVLRGTREVREGLSFCLSLPLDVAVGGGSKRFPPRFFALGGHEHPTMNHQMDADFPGATDILCDDAVTMTLQYSTQWDALCHMGYRFDADGDGVSEMLYYNGWRAGHEVRSHEHGGAARLSIDCIAQTCVQSRAHMIDFERHFGPARRLISYDDLMYVIDMDDISITSGDIICLHSGFSEALLNVKSEVDDRALRNLGSELDGGDDRLLEWITQSGIAAIAADTVAVEAFRRPNPDLPRPLMPLHHHCLFKLGLPLAEYWRLTPLAKALALRGSHLFLTDRATAEISRRGGLARHAGGDYLIWR